MKNKTKVLLAAIMCIVCLIPTVAATGTAGFLPRYVRIVDLKASLIISGGNANCSGAAKIAVSGDRMTVLTELYSDETGKWEVVCSWIGRSEGGTIAKTRGDRNVKPGCSYQVVVTATAYDSTGRQVDKNTAQTEIKKG